MIEAGVAIQVFSVVTKTPRNLNFERNGADSDNVTALVVAQRWPARTWNDLSERALFQAQRLQRLAQESNGRFVVLKSRKDVARLLAERNTRGAPIGGLLAIEGMHAMMGDLRRLGNLYDAGFRMMGLTHFFDNALGGSAHGLHKAGLTPFGREVLTEMERLGIIVDLAHASPRLLDDVLAAATRPLVVSHTGVKGTCDRTRNLSDGHLHAIAANGGLIGIAFFDEAVCGTDAGSIVRAIRYVADVIGVEHVALGSDFDGAVTTPFDVTGLPILIDSLNRSGFNPAEVDAIAGGNIVRLLQTSLPSE
jgi:microsomal dipeptidase-like Zn-dependent dipeptidase